MKKRKPLIALAVMITSLLLSSCNKPGEHVHSFSEWRISDEPTCTEDGREFRTCSGCRLAETRPIPALGHNYGEWTIETAASCEQVGTRKKVCSRCQDVVTETISATGHSWDAWKEATIATCKVGGQEKRSCSICHKEETRATSALGHDWHDVPQEQDTNYVAPQVGVAGQRTQTCARCNDTQIVTISPLNPVNPSSITEVPENDFHNLKQYQYLMDDNVGNYKTYANGSDLSAPIAIKLKFDDLQTASKYYVQVSEYPNFSGAATYTTTNKYYELWNAKLDTTYYYRVSTSELGLLTVNFREIKTTALAPRVVYVPNVLNFRDIGGWESSLVAGGKIRQGLYFRCAQLDAAQGSTTSALDNAGKGLAALKELGIKQDIDMRDSYNQPSRGAGPSKANTTDWPVEFVSAAVPSGSEPVRWEGGTYSGTNIAEQYVKIFNAIAKCDEKPAMLHCTYGADRTGIATFFLEALLGMSEKDMTRDYLWTQFTKGRNVKYTESDAEFPKWISKTNACEGATFADKMENHLISFGIAKSTLEHIREIFVPGYVAQA